MSISDYQYVGETIFFRASTAFSAGTLRRSRGRRARQDNWRNVWAVYADKTGVGDYIVEDMKRGGLRNVTGVNFTDASKESMATCLKEHMHRAVCLRCDWEGYVDTLEGEWRTACPQGCRSDEGNTVKLRPLLHTPMTST